MRPLGSWRLSPHHLRRELVIAPHHPDRLRRPAPPVTGVEEAEFRQALTWNVFRTLELIAPAFWLRRFHLRLTGEPWLVTPQILNVRLWPLLPLPAVRRIDGGQPDVVIDVVIETEHDVWTLMTASPDALSQISEQGAAVLDAGAWLAGRRAHHCGVVEDPGAGRETGEWLRSRYGRSRASASLRSATRGPAAPTMTTWRAMSWAELATLLGECATAPNLPSIDRALAQHAAAWLQSVDVRPGP